MDGNCEDAQLQRSGIVEPAKYAWMLRRRGTTVEEVSTMLYALLHQTRLCHALLVHAEFVADSLT